MITIAANDVTKVYDGKPLTGSWSLVSGSLEEGYELVVTFTKSITDAGEDETEIVSYKVMNDASDVTGNYIITVGRTKGKLTVTQREVTLTSKSAAKQYDGTPLVKPVVAIAGNGFVAGEATASSTGIITKVGSVKNTIVIEEGAGFKADNYEITKNEGTLEITKNTDTIVITADDGTWVYDGQAHSKNTYKVAGLMAGYSAEADITGSITDAGAVENVVASYVIKLGEEDVTDQFGNVTTENGTLTITKRFLEITAENAVKTYDGTPLTAEYSITAGSLAEGQTLDSVTVTGSQLFPGSSANTASSAVIKDAEGNDVTGNYDITYVPGTLEVTKANIEITITASSASKVYDGKPLASRGWRLTSGTLATGDRLEVTVVGSITEVGTAVNKIISVKVMHDDTDVTENYIIHKVNGHLKITEPQDDSQPEQEGVDILINGKVETAAFATITREGDKTVATAIVDDEIVKKKLEEEGSNAVVTIPFNMDDDVVIGTLNGQTVKDMERENDILEIRTGQVTYTLPASQINIDTVWEEIGKHVELKDIAVSVKISEPSEKTVKIVEDTADKNNYQIMVEPVEFEITCSSEDKTVEVTKFSVYVEKLVAIPEGIDPYKITTAIILNPDGTFSHVPTVITIIDGRYYAKINSLTNNTYLLIYSPKTFKDVKGHWAEESINDMASRLVVSGTGNDKYEPDRDITRAEFAAIVVRALGLMRPGTGKDTFTDVTKGNWYYDAVSIACEYGIIYGYGDGKFGPDDSITREQAMAIIARAMEITGLKVELADGEADRLLGGFTDAGSAAEYAKANIAACVKAGIVSGRSEKLIAPKDNITRAEVAVIVQKLLRNSKLI